MVRYVWEKLLEGAKLQPGSDIAQLVFALERALLQDREQPLEVAFRLVTFEGPSLRVAVEDLGKLIHDYNNLHAVKQTLEKDVEELNDRLDLIEKAGRITSLDCPRCSTRIALRPSSVPMRPTTPPPPPTDDR